MTEKLSINIVKKTDHDWDPSLIMQVGFESYNVMCINILLQAAASATASMSIINSAILDNTTDFALGAAAANVFHSIGDAQGTPLIEVLESMAAQSWTLIRSVAYQGEWLAWPTTIVSEAHCTTFAICYEYFKTGLFRQAPPMYDEKDAVSGEAIKAATTGDGQATGLNWNGIGSTPDLDQPGDY